MSDTKFAQYDPAVETAMNSIMGEISGVEFGRMFGYPGYKVNGKLAVGLHQQGVVAKVGRDRAQALIGQDGLRPFEPQPGRVWRDWVLVSETSPGNYQKHKALFEEATRYIASA